MGYIETGVLSFLGRVEASDAITEDIIRDFIRSRHGIDFHDAAPPQQLIDTFTDDIVSYVMEVVNAWRRDAMIESARASALANKAEWAD